MYAPSTKRKTHPATPAELEALHQRVLTLPPAQLFGHLERLIGRPEVAVTGLYITERRLSPRPNAARDAKWARLHDREGLSYEDIAHAHNVPRATVARAVQRFRQRGDSESLLPATGRYAS